MSRNVSDKTFASQLRNYLQTKPYLREALERGIVNQSELSRQICEELRSKNIVALKAALRRYAEKAKKERTFREEQAIIILKKSALSVQDVGVLITEREIPVKANMMLKFDRTHIYLLSKQDMTKSEKAQKAFDSCTLFLITSPKEIENVPGVLAYLTTMLSTEGVNVLEFISTWVYTAVIVKRIDSARTYEILTRYIG